MPHKYPRLKSSKIIKGLRQFGFIFKSQKGSHAKYTNQKGKTVIIPMHNEVSRGTFQSILEQSDITLDEFMKTLNEE